MDFQTILKNPGTISVMIYGKFFLTCEQAVEEFDCTIEELHVLLISPEYPEFKYLTRIETFNYLYTLSVMKPSETSVD